MNVQAPIRGEIDETFQPRTAADWARALESWRWRIYSGALYKIIVKSEDPDDPGTIIPFVPNIAQRRFLDDLEHRNCILKARQLGLTTLICILWLDHALFHPNQRVGIIAHSLDDAGVIFRDKVRFAYDHLPDPIRASFPLKVAKASELVFAHNNSAIRVATSMRSGTIHRLHVSEMGKIAAKHPEKAVEIVTGSFPAVPKDGIAVIESTAEGQDGEFYKIAKRAQELHEARAWRPGRWRFHFYPWFMDPKYVADPRHVTITDEDHKYFDEVEDKMGVILTLRQRAFYVQKRDEELGGDHAKMWREYPSTPDECWQQSSEGRYYAVQLARVRRDGRIRLFDYEPDFPVYGFWDIGQRDGTGCWLMQRVEIERRFLRYIENWQRGFATTVQEIAATGFVIGGMFVPHDADHKRQQGEDVKSARDMLEALAPHWTWTTVPRVATLEAGIEITRKHFAKAVFHEEGCKTGLLHLANYQQRWNTAVGFWAPEPLKNEATEAADAFRQWAQMEEHGLFQVAPPRRKKLPARVL